MRATLLSFLPSVVAASVVGGCAVGPRYVRPSAPVPPAYKEDESAAPEAEWKPAEPRDAAARGRFWRVFGDPQLDTLEERAAASSQSVLQAEAQYRQARALARVARADLFPNVGASASAARSRTSAQSASRSAVAGVANDFSLTGDVSWEADLWGGLRRGAQAGAAGAQASAADLSNVRLIVQSELAADYFELRGLDAEKRLLEETVADYERALQLTRYRYEGGIASAEDVAQAETQLQTTRAQALDVGVARARLEHALALLVGQPASAFEVPPSPIEGKPPLVPAGVPSELLERRPDVAAAERRMAAANAQIGVAKAAFFPALHLDAAGGLASSSLSSWFDWPARVWSVGASLAETLFDGGRRRAQSDAAWAAYDETVASYRQIVLTAFQEVEDNLAASRLLAEEAETQDAAVAAAARTLTLSSERYKDGVVSYLDVLSAQSALLANRRLAVDLLTRRMTSGVLLMKALGGGWNASLVNETAGDLP